MRRERKDKEKALQNFPFFSLLFSPSFFPAPLPALNEAKYCKAEECFFELNLILGRDSIPALFGLHNQSFCNFQAVFFTTRQKSMCTIVQFTCFSGSDKGFARCYTYPSSVSLMNSVSFSSDPLGAFTDRL